jgi:CMP-N-acetylneuraminic acid synthetase
MTRIAMIPARMGSQRLRQKNLRELAGVPLISRAIRKCKEAGVFDEIWVNSEHPDFGPIAESEGVAFHRRPQDLGSHAATSEQYIDEFLRAHPCDLLFQVHSIAPLLTAAEVAAFVGFMTDSEYDAVLSYIPEQIECALDGRPLNFTYDEKTNSQDLRPIQRITWSVTGWRRSTYLAAVDAGRCATYAGKVGFYPVGHVSGHVIKTEDDLRLAEALLPLVEGA